MKKNKIFKNGSLFLAGALAFTFASCQGDTDSNQSTVREAENRVENSELNDEGLVYEEGEYAEVQGENFEENNYDYNQEYAYEERDVVVDRVRNDLDRADRSLDDLNQRMETETGQANEEMKREWEESRVELEQRRNDLNQRLNELEQSTEQNWEQVRNEANQSLRDFEKEWEELKNKDVNVEVETENNPEYNNQ